MENLNQLHRTISEYIRKNWFTSMNEPSGFLKYKFLDPAAYYRGQLWDWDAFFCAVGLDDIYDNISEYTKGCVMNFLSHQRSDGSIPYVIQSSYSGMSAIPDLSLSVRGDDCDLNSAKPLLAQMALLAQKDKADVKWSKECYPGLARHIQHWENTQQKDNGLFVWRSYRGSGTDNHPAVYGRPLNSSAGVDVNCFMYMEYLAMAKIAEMCEDIKQSEEYLKKAERLKSVVNSCMWDSIDEIYYHQDMLSQKPPLARQNVTWSIPLKFKAWTAFLPMYAKIAPSEYADKLVKKHIMNPDEFFSDYGIRSLAKNEPIYNTAETGNPSNWQGPIWVVSTFLIFKGLLNYGYIKEAEIIASNLLQTLCNDLKTSGVLHEYYNPETGKSSINPGFMNWNALAGQMLPLLIIENAKNCIMIDK